MQLTIKNAHWNDEAQESLKIAVPNCDILDIKQQIDEENAQLFEVLHGEDVVCRYVLRVDKMVQHNEGVVVAAAGFDRDIDLTATVLPHIEKQFVNCKYVRIHTERTGLIKKLANAGYKPLEFVMIKEINHGW